MRRCGISAAFLMISLRSFLALGLAAAAAVPLGLGASQQPASARAQSTQTALDRYITAPDANFAWKVARELPTDGAHYR